jgi:hypothetical protein
MDEAEEHIEHLLWLFEQADTSGCGQVSKDDIVRAIRNDMQF